MFKGRIKIQFTNNTEIVPFNNQKFVNGFIHKTIGQNNEFHDKRSDYCVSLLRGGEISKDKNGLNFKNGYIIVSTINPKFMLKLLNELIKGIKSEKGLDFCFGMKVKDCIKIDDDIVNKNYFIAHSPILLQERTKLYTRFYTFEGIIEFDKCGNIKRNNSIDVNKKLFDHTVNKLLSFNPNIDLTGFDIFFTNKSERLQNNKVKRIVIGQHNIVNYASACQIVIRGKQEIKDMLYHIGVGDSCGSGFGTLIREFEKNI